MPWGGAACSSAARSGGPAGSGGSVSAWAGWPASAANCSKPPGGVQGEEPCRGRGDDVGVAKTSRQHRHGAGSCDMFLLADNDPQLTVEHEEGLIVGVMEREKWVNGQWR